MMMNVEEFSPAPLLDAFHRFRGSFFDLDRGTKTSAAELAQAKASVVRYVAERGLAAGDRVVLAVSNGPLFAAVWAAILESGASPVLAHSATPAAELRDIAKRSGARFLVTETDDPASGGSFLAGQPGINLSVLAEQAAAEPNAANFQSVPLHLTSGTTGEPKIALRPGPCAVAEALHYIETLAIDDSDVLLCVTPMSHAYAYGMCLMVPLLASASLLTMRQFNHRLAERALAEMGVTIFPAVPAILDVLLLDSSASSLGAPGAVLSAGAPLAAKTANAWLERYGLPVRPLYGTTETGGISIHEPSSEFDGSVGHPMKGVEVAVSPEGTLRVRSSSMMAGYLESGGRGAFCVDRSPISDGWFRTTDLAQIEPRGRIFLQARESEVISVFGFKVLPSEVEAVIAELPGVVEVKVYAGRHRSGSGIVQAAIVWRDELNEEQIRQHCERRLVYYKRPTVYRRLAALPRMSSGKIAATQLPGAIFVR
jgi:long-chain acyl-CoA synthetase